MNAFKQSTQHTSLVSMLDSCSSSPPELMMQTSTGPRCLYEANCLYIGKSCESKLQYCILRLFRPPDVWLALELANHAFPSRPPFLTSPLSQQC